MGILDCPCPLLAVYWSAEITWCRPGSCRTCDSRSSMSCPVLLLKLPLPPLRRLSPPQRFWGLVAPFVSAGDSVIHHATITRPGQTIDLEHTRGCNYHRSSKYDNEFGVSSFIFVSLLKRLESKADVADTPPPASLYIQTSFSPSPGATLPTKRPLLFLILGDWSLSQKSQVSSVIRDHPTAYLAYQTGEFRVLAFRGRLKQ
ncbi:hypothetical protein RRG08_036471 [Elysia crispata]|uniref:Uncharacterized protein n=1 Tax=Elysia crispata TaxID=231223 RepID=A0AAE0ZL19_9GAST|nr:hypothetical protein RRG08_036471 [Elysia crispata]